VTGKMIRTSLFINGAWVTPGGAGVISVVDPATRARVRKVRAGGVPQPEVTAALTRSMA